MNILLVHNFYQQPGGEDQVFHAEAQRLRQAGHNVFTYTLHNDDVRLLGRLALARRTISNPHAAGDIASLVRQHRVQIVHFHNTFPLISPAAYRAARRAGARVVQTLHNFRLLCLAATCFRDGRSCTDCLGRTPWKGVIRRCYRASLPASAATAAMIILHRARKTFARQVDRYIAISRFMKQRFVDAGFDPARISIKPNALREDPGVGDGGGGHLALVGRLVPEKGVELAVRAFMSADIPARLVVVGDGPLASFVRESASGDPRIQWLGQVGGEQVLQVLRGAALTLVPSLWDEPFGLVAVESLACGTPVLASKRGALPEIIRDDVNGFLVDSSEPAAWSSAIEATMRKLQFRRDLRQNARAAYVSCFSPAADLDRLEEVYRQAVA